MHPWVWVFGVGTLVYLIFFLDPRREGELWRQADSCEGVLGKMMALQIIPRSPFFLRLQVASLAIKDRSGLPRGRSSDLRDGTLICMR